jgi:hypothetical protein
MATKGERFKAEAQREAQAGHPKKAPKTSAARRAAARGRGKQAVPNPASHNQARRVARNSTYELEVSATTRPSRKSSRKSPTHVKPDGPLRITAMNRVASPKARAGRPSGNPN